MFLRFVFLLITQVFRWLRDDSWNEHQPYLCAMCAFRHRRVASAQLELLERPGRPLLIHRFGDEFSPSGPNDGCTVSPARSMGPL